MLIINYHKPIPVNFSILLESGEGEIWNFKMVIRKRQITQ